MMYEERQIISVSELTAYLKEKLSDDLLLRRVSVQGEISNLTMHASGHIYFTLKDSGSAIRTVMFKGYRLSLRFKPEEGMQVLVIGDVSLYEKSGMLQLYAQNMHTIGAGDISVAFEALKKKLQEEGLFDDAYKKEIPKFPKKIGIITSPTGAAIEDIRNVLSRRYPAAEQQLFPVHVQGEQAVKDVVTALEAAQAHSLDVIILARGGGSIEDLWAFNHERIARAIFASDVPVISGIGHDTDFTIADFVADLRAPTPSAAAELATPDEKDVLQDLAGKETRLRHFMTTRLAAYEKQLADAKQYFVFYFNNLYQKEQTKLQHAELQLRHSMRNQLAQAEYALNERVHQLEGRNPLSVLKRGYAKIEKEEKAITRIEQLNKGDMINLELIDGFVTAEVKEVKGKQK
jgi:exodeoxyribonuclease VII large subunit